jgi:hypothetical protein
VSLLLATVISRLVFFVSSVATYDEFMLWLWAQTYTQPCICLDLDRVTLLNALPRLLHRGDIRDLGRKEKIEAPTTGLTPNLLEQ